MEGNLQKDNSEIISKDSRTESPEKKAVDKRVMTKEEQKNKPKKGLYEIRTMRHDLDKAKGKNVSPLSLTQENLSRTGQESKIQEIRSGEINSINSLRAKDSSKEGSIAFNTKEKQSFKKPFLISLRSIFGKKVIFKLATVLIIIIFIGGASFYFYKSGALSSFGNIKEMIRDLFNRETSDEPPIILPATSTPSIPVQPKPTSTPPVIDDTQLQYFPAFFNPDEEEIIKVDTLEEVYPSLKTNFEDTVKERNFRRIIVLARNDFSDISLAQMWKTLKTLVLGEKYTELINAEILESWGLAMPRDVDRKLSENYNLFFYGQPEDGPRTVLIFKIDNIDGLKNNMFSWEETMLYDLKKFFLGKTHEEMASENYLDNNYKNIDVRYLNLPEHDLTMDYAIMPDKNYLILSTSRESIWATIDRILEAGDVAVDDENDEFAGWKTYINEDYGFEVKYPKEWKTFALPEDDTGISFYNPDYPLLYVEAVAPDSRPGVIWVKHLVDFSEYGDTPEEAILSLTNQQGEEIIVADSYVGRIRKSPGVTLILFNAQENIYEITLFNQHKLDNEEEQQKVEEILNKVVESFKIIKKD